MSAALQTLQPFVEQVLFIVVIGTMRCHIQLAKVSDCVIACPMFNWCGLEVLALNGGLVQTCAFNWWLSMKRWQLRVELVYLTDCLLDHIQGLPPSCKCILHFACLQMRLVCQTKDCNWFENRDPFVIILVLDRATWRSHMLCM